MSHVICHLYNFRANEMSRVIRKIISTAAAPKPVAPYNQAVQVDHTLYLSGVLGMDKDSMKLVSGGVVNETKQALENLGKVLEASGSSFGNVVKTCVLLADLNNFGAVNEIYKEYFKEPYPARVAYEVGRLPLDAQIEIDAVAVVGDLETTYVNK